MGNISALIDGELPNPERIELEAHLSTCTNCSAIYKLYKEMTLSIQESCEDPPQSLCTRVMEEITAEKKSAAPTKSKTKPIIYLKRYLPAVACLAVILIALPFVVNERTRLDETYFMVAPAAAPGAALEAFFEDMAPNMEMEYGAQSRQADMPIAAGGTVLDHDDMWVWEEEFAEFETDRAMPAPNMGSMPELAAGAAPGMTMPSAPTPTPELTMPPPTASRQEAFGLEETYTDDLSAFNALISEAYMIIEMKGGELPDLIAAYEPIALGEWTIWDKAIRIPQTLAQALTLELDNHGEIFITHMDADSDFAVVLYAVE